MNGASDTAFLMPTSLSNAYPPSTVFQSRIFMGTSAGNNQVSLTGHISQSTRGWLSSSCLDSAAFVSRRDGRFVLQFLSFQSNQSPLSAPIFYSLVSQATRDSFSSLFKSRLQLEQFKSRVFRLSQFHVPGPQVHRVSWIVLSSVWTAELRGIITWLLPPSLLSRCPILAMISSLGSYKGYSFQLFVYLMRRRVYKWHTMDLESQSHSLVLVPSTMWVLIIEIGPQ